MFETVGQKQEPAFEIDGLELLAPEFITDGHHGEAEILLAQALILEQALGHALEVLAGQGFGPVQGLAELMGGGSYAIERLARLRNDFQMRRTRALAGGARFGRPVAGRSILGFYVDQFGGAFARWRNAGGSPR